MVLDTMKDGNDKDFRLVCEQSKIALREIMTCNFCVGHKIGKQTRILIFLLLLFSSFSFSIANDFSLALSRLGEAQRYSLSRLFRSASAKNRNDITWKIEQIFCLHNCPAPLYFSSCFKRKSALLYWKDLGRKRNRVKFVKYGISLGHGLNSIGQLCTRRTFSGDMDFYISFAVKRYNSDFRIYIGDYWFLFGWELSGAHHLRCARDEESLEINKCKLRSSGYNTLRLSFSGKRCVVQINRKIIATLFGRPLQNAYLNLFSAKRYQVIICSVFVKRVVKKWLR